MVTRNKKYAIRLNPVCSKVLKLERIISNVNIDLY